MKTQDIADLKQLVEFLKSYQVAEFDLEREGIKLHLKFAPTGSVSLLGDLSHAATPASVPLASAVAPIAAPAAGTSAAVVEEEAGLHTLKSPIVGTYYASPSPGAASFVTVGSSVAKGQVIGIVEAMKLMNEIESDVAGTIVKCLVGNGQPVEYGQPLFLIRQA